jgi:hypothetical protein
VAHVKAVGRGQDDECFTIPCHKPDCKKHADWKSRRDSAARFNDNAIRRSANSMPRDVFELLHDLCYHTEGRETRGIGIWDYVRRAQEILRKP